MIDAVDRQLIEAIQDGLPIASRPYQVIGKQISLTEQEVIERLGKLKQQGLIKRLGVIVKHRELGYQANAMVVLDVPDHQVEQLGGQISQFSFVNLCYRRPRQGEPWPFNLYCMIHGRSRGKVLAQLEQLVHSCGLSRFNKDILFSRRCFKQRGAVYKAPSENEYPLANGRH
jgi:DNA-binding Lrp family transcriptional regulator